MFTSFKKLTGKTSIPLLSLWVVQLQCITGCLYIITRPDVYFPLCNLLELLRQLALLLK